MAQQFFLIFNFNFFFNFLIFNFYKKKKWVRDKLEVYNEEQQRKVMQPNNKFHNKPCKPN